MSVDPDALAREWLGNDVGMRILRGRQSPEINDATVESLAALLTRVEQEARESERANIADMISDRAKNRRRARNPAAQSFHDRVREGECRWICRALGREP